MINIFKATDGKWYREVETKPDSEQYEYFGPFESEDDADDWMTSPNTGGGGIDNSGTMEPPDDPIDPENQTTYQYTDLEKRRI